MQRVVVTGLGVITPVGRDVESTFSALLSGTNGIGPITRFDASAYECRIAGEIKGFDPSLSIDKKQIRRTDIVTQYALTAAAEAIRDANLTEGQFQPDRVGVILSSGIGGITTLEGQIHVLRDQGPRRISPFLIPMMIIDIASGLISMQYGFMGPNYATVSACASGAHGISDAWRILRCGEADAMVCGGAESSITPISIAGFCSAQALSTRNDDPAHACRPYDLNRDGFIMGEGSGVLVLETLEHATKRGAHIYCELAGCAATADAHHITAPHPEGLGARKAMTLAMEYGGLRLDEIDYINTHGTSTPLGDIAETQAVKVAFGDQARKLKLNSTKSMIGHLLGAAGAVEAVVTVKTIQTGRIHPTINIQVPDPQCDLDYTPDTAVEMPVRAALSNSFGFGGHNATLAFRKLDA